MNKYHQSRNAVNLGDLKQAALYFDKVLPVFLKDLGQFIKRREILIDLSEVDKNISYKIDNKIDYKSELSAKILANLILGPDSKESKLDPQLASNICEVQMLIGQFISTKSKILQNRNFNEKTIDFYFRNTEIPKNVPWASGVRDFRGHIKYWSGFYGINDPAVLLPHDYKDSLSVEGSDGEDIVVELIAANLIDVKNLEWEQIYELRRDKNARAKLRNLRLFLFETYPNASFAYIEDDLARRINEYQETCKTYGLETITSVLTETLSATNLISVLGTGFAATCFGDVITGISSAAILEVGKIALSLAKRKTAMLKLKNSHELSYCIRVLDRANNR